MFQTRILGVTSRALVLAIFSLFVLVSQASAEPGYSKSVFKATSSKMEVETRLEVVPCTVLFARSMIAYYRLRGHWPEDWDSLVNEGIFQTDLLSPDGLVINPDDRQLDFMDDIVYEPSSDLSGIAHYWFAFDEDGLVTKRTDLEPGETYFEYFQNSERILLKEGYDPPIERYQQYLEDDNMLRLFATLHCLNRGSVWVYTNLNGGFPSSAEDLIASGYSCVDMDSINPVTGVPFRFDGSPGDIGYIAEIGKFYHVEEGDEYPILRMDY